MSDSLETKYASIHSSLEAQALALRDHLRDLFAGDARVDQVSARPKGLRSFIEKARRSNSDGSARYPNPWVDIQDIIGVRIVVFYPADVERVRERVLEEFRQREDVSKEPARDTEFDYFGHHLILSCTAQFTKWPGSCEAFELQVKTLWQHAWSQASHDLVYKPGRKVSSEHRRLAAFASASAWGADQVFDRLFSELTSEEPDKPS